MFLAFSFVNECDWFRMSTHDRALHPDSGFTVKILSFHVTRSCPKVNILLKISAMDKLFTLYISLYTNIKYRVQKKSLNYFTPFCCLCIFTSQTFSEALTNFIFCDWELDKLK
jgi:hypothetical protein